jgi:hypothetical protein
MGFHVSLVQIKLGLTGNDVDRIRRRHPYPRLYGIGIGGHWIGEGEVSPGPPFRRSSGSIMTEKNRLGFFGTNQQEQSRSSLFPSIKNRGGMENGNCENYEYETTAMPKSPISLQGEKPDFERLRSRCHWPKYKKKSNHMPTYFILWLMGLSLDFLFLPRDAKRTRPRRRRGGVQVLSGLRD